MEENKKSVFSTSLARHRGYREWGIQTDSFLSTEGVCGRKLGKGTRRKLKDTNWLEAYKFCRLTAEQSPRQNIYESWKVEPYAPLHSLHLSVCLYDGCRLGSDGQFSTRRHHIHLSLPPSLPPSLRIRLSSPSLLPPSVCLAI